MFGRISRTVLQFFGMFLLGLALLFAGAIWRLTAGPISLAFLTPYFESALSSSDGTLAIRLDDTVLTWAGWDRTLEIRLRGARAYGADGALVAEIPELSLSLSGNALFRGQLIPRSLSIFRPSLHLVRLADGSFKIGQIKGQRVKDGTIGRILDKLLSAPGSKGPADYLTRLEIVAGDLTLEDRATGVTWRAPKANVTITREGDGISALAALDIQVGTRLARLNLQGKYRFADRRSTLVVRFTDANLHEFAQMSPTLDFLRPFDLPVSGSATTELSPAGIVQSLEFEVTGGQGKIALPAPMDSELKVQEIKLRGRFSRKTGNLEIDQLAIDLGKNGRVILPDQSRHSLPLRKLSLTARYLSDSGLLEISRLTADLGGPRVEVEAVIQEIGPETTFSVSAKARGLVIDQLSRYWPKSLLPLPREWFLQNISNGSVSELRIRLSGAWRGKTRRGKKSLQLANIDGQIDFMDLSVDYLPPMPKVRKISGRARFDGKRMDIAITGGTVGDLLVSGGSIALTGFDQIDQFAHIDLTIEGPFQSALRLVSKKPLEFAAPMGMDPKGVAGHSKTRLKIAFLMERALTADQVKVWATAEIKDVAIRQGAFGRDLSDGQIKLRVDNSKMEVSGRIRVGTIATRFDWRENFDKDNPVARHYRVRGRLDDTQRRVELGLDFVPFSAEFMTGESSAELTYTLSRTGVGRLAADISLDDVAMRIPDMGWSKPAGIPGRAKLAMRFEDGRPMEITSFSVTAGGLEARGKVGFDNRGAVRKIEISRLSFAGNQLSGVLIQGTQGWDADIRGAQLDLLPWLDAEADEEEADKEEKGTPITLSLNLDRVQLHRGRYLQRVTGALEYDGSVWRRMKLQAVLGSKGSIALDLVPAGGGRKLTITSNDAGRTLRVFGYYDNLVGGTLRLEGTFDDRLPGAPFDGKAVIRQFRVIKAPALTHLLSIASLTGILEALGGEGLAFSNLEVPFTRKRGVIALQDAKANGLSLGVTAAGIIDTRSKTIRLSGTLVPAYVINSVLGYIPLIGGLFTGFEKGGGVFAVTYKMSGNPQKPDVSINPLSALAPGFLRNLFGIFDQPQEPRAPVR